MKTFFPSIALCSLFVSSAALLAGLGLTISGCGGDEPSPAGAAPKVSVPEVPSSVAAADFCALADQIYCAGAVGCCSGSDAVFADADECLKASKCGEGLGKVLESQLVSSGELSYDPMLAADYLHDLAATVSQCAHHGDDLRKPSFIVGSREVGADCTPVAGDITNTFSCKPGLTCVQAKDAENDKVVGTCQDVAPAALDGDVGAACSTGEDCQSGTCDAGKCAFDLSGEYCVRPPPESAPPNADPTYLYVDLQGDNSGTSGSFTVKYLNNGQYWGCTFSNLADGQEKACAVTQTGTVTNSNKEYFIIEGTSTDGAKIDTVCACTATDATSSKCSSSIECAGTFNDYGDKAGWCADSGSFNLGLWANPCKRIWLDADGNGKCTKFQIDSYDDNYTWCTD